LVRSTEPLQRGSVVAKGTVLGRAGRPEGARDGHIRFAIRPAGDDRTVDPRPILRSWAQLAAALYPQGASARGDLVGATASGVFLLSKNELERAVLSDPGISLSPCGSRDVTDGVLDRRVLAAVAFLSRVGLRPTVSGLRCGPPRDVLSASSAARRAGYAADISAINGIPIAPHQGTGTATDLTVRALLTLKGEFMPFQIISPMHYPGASSTLAMRAGWNHLHIAFRPADAVVRRGETAPAMATLGTGQPASSPVELGGDLSTARWNQLLARVAGLPNPTIAAKPSSSAVRDVSGGQL
jgi:hypothetical protein